MSRRTDDAPAFLPLDTTYQQAVPAATGILLATYAETSAEVWEEEGIEGSLPILNSARLGDYLKEVCVAPEHTLPAVQLHVQALIQKEVLDLLETQIALDLAMEHFLKGKGVISAHSLFVNDPVVMETLEDYELPDGEVIFVPVGDFYSNPQLPGDERRDMLMGAIRWRGIYLCRPALVSLPDIEQERAAADVYGAMKKAANVSYLPRYGRH